MVPEALSASEAHGMVCVFCQRSECTNPAHGMTDPPARDAEGRPLAPGVRSAWRRLIAQFCLDLSDPYTLQKLNEIYRRSGGVNLASGTEALWTHKRAAGGELHTVVRYARDLPEDERPNILIRFVQETRNAGSRTPDFQVLYLDGEGLRSEHVEVRTLTQAKRQARVQRTGGGGQLQPLVLSEKAIEKKLFHGQIDEAKPGVIVFHLPFASLDDNALKTWQALLDRIRMRRISFPAGLRRIEVTTGTQDVTTGTRKMLAFELARQWRGYIKDQYRYR
jgi:hypothetical protein